MVQKEPVSKSPFRRFMSPSDELEPPTPIHVDIPRRSFFKTDEDTTSHDTELDVQDSEREGYHIPMTIVRPSSSSSLFFQTYASTAS